MVMGIPTVKRKVKSYLAETLHSLIDKLSPEEKLDCVIIVYVGEVSEGEAPGDEGVPWGHPNPRDVSSFPPFASSSYLEVQGEETSREKGGRVF